jgi:hypothetical protein
VLKFALNLESAPPARALLPCIENGSSDFLVPDSGEACENFLSVRTRVRDRKKKIKTNK